MERCKVKELMIMYHPVKKEIRFLAKVKGKFLDVPFKMCPNLQKYSPENGEIQVRLKRSNESVEITVTDSGCGVAPEYQKKIFDRFYRVENNIHTVKGTGLGLHLVKTTIEKYHNGKVFVISEVGKGSTFGFTLPINIYDESLV